MVRKMETQTKTEEQQNEKTIRLVKCDSLYACGWGIRDGVIQVEVSKSDWEALEDSAKNLCMSVDFILAERILGLFTKDC